MKAILPHDFCLFKEGGRYILVSPNQIFKMLVNCGPRFPTMSEKLEEGPNVTLRKIPIVAPLPLSVTGTSMPHSQNSNCFLAKKGLLHFLKWKKKILTKPIILAYPMPTESIKAFRISGMGILYSFLPC